VNNVRGWKKPDSERGVFKMATAIGVLSDNPHGEKNCEPHSGGERHRLLSVCARPISPQGNGVAFQLVSIFI